MARKVKTEQDKKRSKIKIIIIILVLLIVIGCGGFITWKYINSKNNDKTVQTVKILDNINDYDYSLSDKDSNYFKSEYEKLKEILNANPIDPEAYATQVAKMFTIDLYSMSTKINKYDVGGIEYFNQNKKSMYEQKVIDTLYYTLLDDTYGDRKQELPEVSDVEVVSTENTTYKLGDTKVDGYLIKLKIKYIKDLGYDKEASVVVCAEGSKKMSVVDYQPTLNPEY